MFQKQDKRQEAVGNPLAAQIILSSYLKDNATTMMDCKIRA